MTSGDGEALLDAAVDLLVGGGARGIVKVRGDSMLPTLAPGQALEVEFAPGRIRRGDLLLFRQADYLAVHRVVGRGAPGFRTRGDGRPYLDPPVPSSRVVGRVLAVERADGWRSLVGAGARVYSVALALHDAAWAQIGRAAGRFERTLTGRREPGALRNAIARLDRSLLVLADRLFFGLLHERTADPRRV